MPVEVVNWNPRKRRVRGPLGRVIPRRPPVNNFGDLLGPLIVEELLVRQGIDPAGTSIRHRLLSVGSILRLANDGDVVWGSGVNGKSLDLEYQFSDLDVRSVRGPRTAEFLRSRGISVPEVYGDPGLLVGVLWPRESLVAPRLSAGVTLIPNLNDVEKYRGHPDFWHPCRPLWDTITRIANSEFVIGSSLHAVVLADSFGIEARLIGSDHEPPFKYQDYYLGSGRSGYTAATTVDEALAMGGEEPLEWDPAGVLGAFPYELWAP
ncbi:polysaccharide pyruvyl transferase family protein [Rhodococcus sp. W8901]|uniref:polysaccharide pyruvyl transferase family protein n=1 Tax=Rhodococcus sp. W8901 TaxID=2742603 RepID=UPI0020C6E99D|nr:polysaccharide pyruvyl transferase family protein [Rhodococcus sp. W8901]